MASKNLIPTPITDKNGKQTTVYRAPDDSPKIVRGGIPPLTMEAYIPPHKRKRETAEAESYSERRERIKDANERWKAGERPTPEELAPVAMKAMDSLSNLMMFVSDCADSSEREDYAIRIASLASEKDFPLMIACEQFREVHYTLADSVNIDTEWDDPFEVSFDGEDTSDWSSEYASVKDSGSVIDLILALRDENLMNHLEAPEHGDKRFFAHLYLSATKKLNYRMDDENTIATIHLVDEFPEKTELIAEGLDKNLHAEGIRALIHGEVHSGIASGAL